MLFKGVDNVDNKVQKRLQHKSVEFTQKYLDETSRTQNKETAQIVSLYRARQGNLTQDDFANAIVEKMPDHSLTGAAVSSWETGKRAPHAVFCLRMTMAYPSDDWRNDLAFDLLAAMIPDAYQPKGEIGRQVLAPTEA